MIKPNAIDFAFRYPRTWPVIEEKWQALQKLVRPAAPSTRHKTS